MKNKEQSEQEQTISFRESTEEDFDFVFGLNKTNMRKYVEEIRGWDENFEREDMKKKFTPGVDKIIQVGGIDAGILRVLESYDSIKLDHIELLPEFQGKGIGKRIIKDLISKGKPVNLQVLKQNPAVKLYQELGFEITEETDLKYKMLKSVRSETIKGLRKLLFTLQKDIGRFLY